MQRLTPWTLLPAVAIVTSVYATTYLTVEQAQAAIFPGAKLTPLPLMLTDAQVREIEKRSEVNVRNREQHVWRVEGGGLFIVDEVVGKHEFITYAIGLNADGSVRAIEVMDYRETYGYEIRNAAWRRQFVGKTAADPLKLDRDIQNISGATLSCRHIADGVKRVLATYDVALR
jgi:Na+-translocating ferredoxin:NAD+ oxidoreductase RnfG subunit